MAESASRRQALKTLLGTGGLALAGGVFGGITSSLGTDVWNAAKSWFYGDSSLMLTPEQIRLASQLLFGSGRNIKIVPASHNLVSGEGLLEGITPPAKYAVDKIVRLFELSQPSVSTVEEVMTDNLAGSLCAIGGPIANRLSELLFGQDGTSPIFRESKSRT